MSGDTLVMGELTDQPKPTPLSCDIFGVARALQTRKTKYGRTYERRIYECHNGYALGARRGGPLELGDVESGTWEIFVLGTNRTAHGGTVGWVDDATLRAAVRRLGEYRNPSVQPVIAGRCVR